MTQLHDDLVAVRELLSDPVRWTKGVFARDSRGWPVNWGDNNAVAWCLEGACLKATNNKAHRLWWRLEEVGAFTCTSLFNDAVEHPNVLALLDRAIEATP